MKDLQLQMSTFKVKNRKKYLNPNDLRVLYPDNSIRGIAREIWRKDSTLCNPLRRQYKH